MTGVQEKDTKGLGGRTAGGTFREAFGRAPGLPTLPRRCFLVPIHDRFGRCVAREEAHAGVLAFLIVETF